MIPFRSKLLCSFLLLLVSTAVPGLAESEDVDDEVTVEVSIFCVINYTICFIQKLRNYFCT